MTRCVVGVDVGRTGCRVVVRAHEETEYVGHGVVPRTGVNGTRVAASALRHAVREALSQAGLPADAPTDVAIGMAGVTMLDGGPEALAQRFAYLWPGTNVAVAGDVLTAHAGALEGRPGAVLAVGTGAIALGLAADGRMHRVDGWGQWLGDDGSGAWIGREALRAVARAADGRGEATALSERLASRFGSTDSLPGHFPFDSVLPTRTAALVPDVVDTAQTGD
ncbi:MAG TPA: BadF/BadG/BcrA/BcrD ATPase family protein, partial [Nocardioidaceae bacterium]|nr:BadF/BadG/BcrA/BcrD ATPase family protein [Nocardioidaceae bacterium]